MKTSIRYLIPLAGIVLALPAVHAGDGAGRKEVRKEVRVLNAPGTAAPEAGTFERRLRWREAGAPGEMETVTFLGVQAGPVDPTLSEQLGLQKDTGLVVAEVVADSPAAGLLKAHDVLLKFNDQILIDPRQFTVLVRNSKEGEEVALTYIRGGKQATGKVKLGQQDVPKALAFGFTPARPNLGWFGTSGLAVPALPAARADVDHVLGLMDLGGSGGPAVVRHNQLEGDRVVSVTVNTGDSNMNYSDDKGSLELKIKDGKKELTAKDAKGEVVFSGPINTPEERKGLPPEVAGRLGKIEAMQGFTFKTDDDFQGGEVKVVRPLGQGIALPLPAPVTAPTASTRPTAF